MTVERSRATPKERELQKYMETHSEAEINELLDDLALILDPLSQEILRKAAEA